MDSELEIEELVTNLPNENTSSQSNGSNQCDVITDINTRLEHIGYVIIMPLICSIGLSSNVLNLVILQRLRRRNAKIYGFLRAIAAVDLITMFVILPIGLSRCNNCQTGDWFYNRLRKAYEIYIYLPIANMSTTASVFLTVSMAIDRYIFVCKPLKHRKSHNNFKIAVPFICLLAVVYNIPYFFKYTITNCNILHLTYLGTSDFMKGFAWSKAILVKLGPICITGAVNCALIRSVRQHSKRMADRRSQFPYRQRIMSQRQLTQILIGTMVLFIVGNIPIVFVFPGIAHLINLQTYSVTFKHIRLLGNLLEIASFAFNFIFYFTLDRGYRVIIQRALTKLRRRTNKYQDFFINSFQCRPKQQCTEMELDYMLHA